MMTLLRKTCGAILLIISSSVAFAGPPFESGIVTRGEFDGAWTWTDPNKGYRIVLGADMIDFCSGILDFDYVSFQDVNLSESRISTNVKGTVQASVYDFLAFDCALFLIVPPVASGEAEIKIRDNDIEANLDPNGANAWSITAHGELIDNSDPDEMRLLIATLNAVLLRGDEFHGRTKILLH